MRNKMLDGLDYCDKMYLAIKKSQENTLSLVTA
jgi:hypothetical protein